MDVLVEAQATRLLRAIGNLGGNGFLDYIELWNRRQKLLAPERLRRLQQLQELERHLRRQEDIR